MDDFLKELDGSNVLHEGEAQTYFEHAVILRDTVGAALVCIVRPALTSFICAGSLFAVEPCLVAAWF